VQRWIAGFISGRQGAATKRGTVWGGVPFFVRALILSASLMLLAALMG